MSDICDSALSARPSVRTEWPRTLVRWGVHVPAASCWRTRSKGLGNAAGMLSRHAQTIGISANCHALQPLPSLALPARMTLGNAAAAGVQLGHRQPIAIGVCAAHKKKEPRRWREVLSSGTAPTGRFKKNGGGPAKWRRYSDELSSPRPSLGAIRKLVQRGCAAFLFCRRRSRASSSRRRRLPHHSLSHSTARAVSGRLRDSLAISSRRTAFDDGR
jgi:hypothetical protein